MSILHVCMYNFNSIVSDRMTLLQSILPRFSSCYFDSTLLTKHVIEWNCYMLPGEESATVTPIFSGATSLGMCLPIRLNSILL